jgi:hypothetical protein
MCCLLLVAGLVGPRFGIIVWYLFDSARVNAAFTGFIVPCLGFFILPWTTLAYIAVYPGGVTGLEFVILLVGFAFDIVTLVEALLE